MIEKAAMSGSCSSFPRYVGVGMVHFEFLAI